jgi:hypothetical protein
MLSITEDEVNLQADHNVVLKNKKSIERYKKETPYSFKGRALLSAELTKSLQMKHEKSVESYHKKMAKNKTETNQKEGRSSSIIN